MGAAGCDRDHGNSPNYKYGGVKMSIVIMQGIIARIRELIESILSMMGIGVEPEIITKYITEYVPYRGMDYYLFAALTVLFGLCLIISIMKYKDLVKEINEHSNIPKKILKKKALSRSQRRDKK